MSEPTEQADSPPTTETPATAPAPAAPDPAAPDPAAPDPAAPDPAAPDPAAPDPAAPDPLPHLLVAPAGVPLPTIEWRGPAGAPAWAIPVSLPTCTRGYAIFLPLVPQPPTATGQQPPAAAPPAPYQPVASPAAPYQPVASPAAPYQPVASPTSPPYAAAPQGPPTPTGAADTPAETVEPGPVQAAAGEELVETPAEPDTVAGAPQLRSETPSSPAPAGTRARSGDTAEQPRLDSMGQPVNVGVRPIPATPGPQSWPPGWQAPASGYIGIPPHPAAYQQITTGPIVPPPPRFADTGWPGPEQGRGWAVPGAVLAGALGVAAFLPLGRVGIGWLLSGLAVVIAVVTAVWRAAAAQPRAQRYLRVGWAVSALALLSVLTFRNAWWLVTFSVLGAVGCAALAIVGGSRLRSILFSLVAAPFAAFRGIGWVSRHLAGRSRLQAGTGARIGWSVTLTVIVVIVFGALLSSADAAFSAVLGDLVPEISAGTVFAWIFLLAVGALLTISAVYTISAPPELSTMDKPAARMVGPVEWGLPIGALVVLFGGFVAVQFTVLFGGRRQVLENAHLTYAEYARSGFWQLLTVTLLTLAVLGAVGRWARRDTPRERLLLRVLAGLLCALSIVIVISAISRMYTYQEVYSFTGERVFITGFEILLGLIFVLILIAGVQLRGGWVPRASIGLTVALLLSLAILNPEAYVANRNIARYQETGKIDAWYLRALSADATPELATLPDPVRRCVLSWIVKDLAEDDPWYAWNLGRQRARDVLHDLGPQAIGGQNDCRAADQFDYTKTR